MTGNVLCLLAPPLARIGKGGMTWRDVELQLGAVLAGLAAGVLAGAIIWGICRLSNFAKARWVTPSPLPDEASPARFQLRLSDLLLSSFLYGAGLVAVSVLFDAGRSPEALLPWAMYLFASLCAALFATGDLCRGVPRSESRRMMLAGFMLAFSFVFPLGLLTWWVWRRWQRVERALKTVERKTLL